MSRLAIKASALFLMLVSFRAHSASAQSYGLGDQVLTIGAADFRPRDGSNNTYSLQPNEGYLFGPGNYYAPLALPDGAEIFKVCSYVYDLDLSLVVTALELVRLPTAGQNHGVLQILGSAVVASVDTGFDAVCTDPFSYIFHTAADIDGL